MLETCRDQPDTSFADRDASARDSWRGEPYRHRAEPAAVAFAFIHHAGGFPESQEKIS
jgi:hypothetical protein